MKLITRHTRAAEVVERWLRQYPEDNAPKHPGMGAKLRALGDNPDPDVVDALIGNNTWTQTNVCDECGAEEVPVMQIGEEPDYESRTAWLCEACLEKALGMIREPMSNKPLPECHTCRYGLEIPGSLRHAPHNKLMVSCRRYPPQVSNDPERAAWRFPMMHPLDWCGEWKMRDEERVTLDGEG